MSPQQQLRQHDARQQRCHRTWTMPRDINLMLDNVARMWLFYRHIRGTNALSVSQVGKAGGLNVDIQLDLRQRKCEKEQSQLDHRQRNLALTTRFDEGLDSPHTPVPYLQLCLYKSQRFLKDATFPNSMFNPHTEPLFA